MAVLGLCSWTDARKVRPNWWVIHEESARAARLAVLRTRRPDWIERWVARELEERMCDWAFVRELVRDGVCPRPTSDAYIFRMADSSMGWRPKTGDNLITSLRRDPALLDHEIWRLFEVDPGRHMFLPPMDLDTPHVMSWGHTLVDLAAAGEIDRLRLLTASVRALDRPLRPGNTGWFCRLHEKLAPTPQERRERLALYVALLGHAVPAVVGFALDNLKPLAADGGLDPVVIGIAITPVFALREKSHAMSAVLLLQLTAKQTTGSAGATPLAMAATYGIAHRSVDVQKACLDLIEAHADAAHAALSAALEAQLQSVAPIQRGRVTTLIDRLRGTASPSELGDAVPGSTQLPDAAAPPADLAALVREAEALPSHWRALAGVDALVQAWRSGSDLPALNFNPMAVPRLDEAARLEPIVSLDELIDGLSAAIEGLDDADQLERLLDGLSRLADRRPVDFVARTAPLLKRASEKNNNLLPTTLRTRSLVRAWLEGRQLPVVPPEQRIGRASVADFVATRMAALTAAAMLGCYGPSAGAPDTSRRLA